MKYYKLSNKNASIFYDSETKLKIIGDQVIPQEDGLIGKVTRDGLQNGHITETNIHVYEKYMKEINPDFVPAEPIPPTAEGKSEGEGEELTWTKEEVEDMDFVELKAYAQELGIKKSQIKDNFNSKALLSAHILETFYKEVE